MAIAYSNVPGKPLLFVTTKPLISHIGKHGGSKAYPPDKDLYRPKTRLPEDFYWVILGL